MIDIYLACIYPDSTQSIDDLLLRPDAILSGYSTKQLTRVEFLSNWRGKAHRLVYYIYLPNITLLLLSYVYLQAVVIDIDSGKYLRDLPPTCNASKVLPPNLVDNLKSRLSDILKNANKSRYFIT